MDLINKIQLENSGADVSAAALFKNTSDLPAGDINYGNIFDIYKFDNTLYRVPVTGAELKAYMEWSAECYNQWKEGDINISFDPEYPDYLYDMFAGVDYEIDLSQPKGERIKNVMFKGEPLKDDQQLTLAVNNYRYSSALKSGGLVSGTKEWESSSSIRDMIVAYFAEHSPVAPAVDNNWKIVGVDLNEDDPRRAELIGYINDGLLDAPYAKSYNLADYEALSAQAKANRVLVDGKAFKVDTAVSSGLGDTTFYRLRDLAAALKGTSAAFNVEWNGQVVITKGGEYAAAALAARPEGAAIDYANITVLVDGAGVDVSTLLIGGETTMSPPRGSTPCWAPLPLRRTASSPSPPSNTSSASRNGTRPLGASRFFTQDLFPSPAGRNRPSTVVPSSRARWNARARVGSYLSFSMAFTVCRETPQARASVSWERPSAFLRSLIVFSIGQPPCFHRKNSRQKK